MVPPKSLPFDITLSRLFTYRAENIKLPGATLDMISKRVYGLGVEKKFADDIRFADNSITFLESGGNAIYKFFYAWMNTIIDFTGATSQFTYAGQPSYRVEYKDNIITDIYIYVLDASGFLISTVVLREAFPSSVNEIILDWSARSELMKVVVNFTYSSWYIQNLNVPIPFSPPVNASPQTFETFNQAKYPTDSINFTPNPISAAT
jgi:hypothetical protein